MSEIVKGEGLVGLTEIESAAHRLAGVIVPTPLIPADTISEMIGAQVRLKCENLQRAGSFKIRGAYNFVSQLSDDRVASGIISEVNAWRIAGFSFPQLCLISVTSASLSAKLSGSPRRRRPRG